MHALTAHPGFVDLQVNGFLGINFTAEALSVDDVRNVTRELATRGTAAYCPTIVTAPLEVFESNLPVLAAAMDEPDLQPHLLGIHLEGPFFTEQSKGGHPAECLRLPDIELFDHWRELARGRIRIFTIAPELVGAEALIRHAAAQGVVVSLGHHMADAVSVARAVDAGARSCTHLGNGIANRLPRHPNPIWSQLAHDELTAMIITDGHHLPPEFIATVLKVKNVARTIIVSDAACIAGLPPGDYEFSGASVVLESSGRIALKDGSSLAGSSATMLDCMNHLASLELLTEEELWKVGRDNALKLMRVEVISDHSKSAKVCFNNGKFCVEERMNHVANQG
jgi:N-acetylglucosamine-6-phosphate deacetylase